MNYSLTEITHNMIDWAMAHIGDKSYAGWCLSFIEDALEISNDIEIFGCDSAKESCEMYRDALRTGIPEQGAFVFYDCLCPSEDGPVNWGHCGIALDDGSVIHAWDKVRIDHYLDVEALTALTGDHPKYIGWVPVTRVLAEKPHDGEARNPLLDLILARRSYRGKFQSTPVPRDDLRSIMEAGLAAPSGCNKQTTSLIAVDDPEMLQKLRAVIQPPVGETAPAMICVLTQRICAYRDRCFAVRDYSAAIENMLLAIKALGYQSCWYEGHITDVDRIGAQMAKILGVPDEYELVCVLPVGVALDEIRSPKKKAFDERAWFNAFPTVE